MFIAAQQRPIETYPSSLVPRLQPLPHNTITNGKPGFCILSLTANGERQTANR